MTDTDAIEARMRRLAALIRMLPPSEGPLDTRCDGGPYLAEMWRLEADMRRARRQAWTETPPD